MHPNDEDSWKFVESLLENNVRFQKGWVKQQKECLEETEEHLVRLEKALQVVKEHRQKQHYRGREFI